LFFFVVQLHKLFSYSGEVEKCEFAGVKNEFSFVTFTDAKVRSAFTQTISVAAYICFRHPECSCGSQIVSKI
jgi:hypothetical protein